ncbi:urokinase plasminogen activator surface receptor-like [Leucoraja erinacea]|uniref:urokinase plasminogen activator surface receptor-like n=1 Tax=Leucoraja erinaceus TaxID=7782 RepID=UPI0024540BA1|nr:urokinase plasminogen activator surface receptor-like [Leucoraja erinacea]
MRVFLTASALINLFATAMSLNCESCSLPTTKCEEMECNDDEVCRLSESRVEKAKFTDKTCAAPNFCDFSFDTGKIQQRITCCKKNLCNRLPMSVKKGELECYACTAEDCSKPLTTIQCFAEQLMCAQGYFNGSYRSQHARYRFRGCMSEAMCVGSLGPGDQIDCCRGTKCNKSSGHRLRPLLTACLLTASGQLLARGA